MADTQRSVTAALALLADNSAGAISPQDLRDALTTWRMGHGQLYVPAAAAAAVTIPDTTNYVEVTAPVWTLSSGAHWFDESAGNGRLTYIGAADVSAHIALTVSMSCASPNQDIHARVGVNGTTDAAAEIEHRLTTATFRASTALHLIVTGLSNGDYISLWLRNETGANNVTIESANLQAVTMPA